MAEWPTAPRHFLKFQWIEPETDEDKKYFEAVEKFYGNMEESYLASFKAREEEREAKRHDETTKTITTTFDDEYFESLEEGKNSRQPRFQLFWALISLDKYKDFKKFLLHGHIKAYQEASSSCEGEESDYDSVTLFCRDSNSDPPVFMMNNSLLDNLITQFSFPVNATTSSLGINLNAKYYYDDDFFQLCDDQKLELVKKYDTFCTQKIDLHDGSLYMGYIVLSDPVDVALDITFKTDHDVSEVPFIIKIHAYYGDNYGVDDGGYQRQPSRYERQPYRYKLRLFHDGGWTLSDDFIFPLITSSLAVPATSTLIIGANIFHMFNADIYVDTHIRFIPPGRNGSTTGVFKGPHGCSLVVKVNWKYPPIASWLSRERSRER